MSSPPGEGPACLLVQWPLSSNGLCPHYPMLDKGGGRGKRGVKMEEREEEREEGGEEGGREERGGEMEEREEGRGEGI